VSFLTLESGEATAVLDTLGGRLSQLTVSGHDLLVPDTGRRTLAGCYPMVPWAGRLANGRFVFEGVEVGVPITNPPHAMHGLATSLDWRVVSPTSMAVDFDGLWPPGGAATVDYELSGSSLCCTLTVRAGDRSMPAVVGFHPCFVRSLAGNPDQLTFDAGFMWMRGDDHLPTGMTQTPPPNGPWDDCFGDVIGPPRLSWGDQLELELRSETDTWVVFDELESAICVEPQSDTPNAFNMNGGAILAPHEQLTLTLEMVWG
jgi:aldose 1-epimerase